MAKPPSPPILLPFIPQDAALIVGPDDEDKWTSSPLIGGKADSYQHPTMDDATTVSLLDLWLKGL